MVPGELRGSKQLQIWQIRRIKRIWDTSSLCWDQESWGCQNGYEFDRFDGFNRFDRLYLGDGTRSAEGFKTATNLMDLTDLTDLTDFFFVLIQGELGGSKQLRINRFDKFNWLNRFYLGDGTRWAELFKTATDLTDSTDSMDSTALFFVMVPGELRGSKQLWIWWI